MSKFPWDSVYVNANLAVMDKPAANRSGYGTINDAALAVKDNKIAWKGAMADLPKPAGELANTVTDCRGKWILPGFVDCHTHLIWAGSRAKEFEMRLSGQSYEQIARQGGGIFSTVKAVRNASADALFDIAARRIRHFISRGITCVEIKSGYGLDLENELKMLAVAGRLDQAFPVHIEATFLGAHALPPEYSNRSDDYVTLVTDTMLPQVKAQGIATAVDVFCENIAFSREQTHKIFQAARNLGFKVKLHAEQLSDSDGAALAADHGALSCDHLEYLSHKGASAMAQAEITAVLLPGAFYMLKETQLPPVDLMKRLGIPMALATDLNPGTSPVFGMTPILNMACQLFGLTCEQALEGATLNGARALGLDGSKGSLETGKDADFVVWDIDSPADLCYQVDNTPVDRVVISGRTVFDHTLQASNGAG